ncbi:N-acetylmuramoyl-L-alanine amidase CwlD [Wansuia hejianensis]|uniref:N-acetylmuramoyl-L-alanine amidase CwlD n=1 Tax=Wansuia hejianensis TaxID=2763667 RepID=A0A926EYZ8_9FIRM|nr:N-acetylmuramoyl-L-alanine amidase CwlD [Wansuia hejianensis]MBC8591551.1 N-acetylmuramoyl-L-alanine amidase CwlD [Wansuia hejianensis]
MRVIYIKKRDLYILFGIVILVFITGIFLNKRKEAKRAISLPISNRIIGIDPGHGGVDPGAVSKNGVHEDDINLQIALKLKRFIEQSGGVAILTRETDTGLYTEQSTTLREKKVEDLKKRKTVIEESECEVFITIHMNSFTSSRYYGAQTFYMKGSEEGQNLAQLIQEEFRNTLDKDNKREPAEREDIYLLKELEIPSVLIEAGFLSNPLEEKLLITDEYQEKIAWSIYSGIMKYFNELDGKLGVDSR